MIAYPRFNESQLEAFNWNDGPALILAGPGSGKTLVLTHRIARIIEKSSNEYYKILALTFTNKAAAELRNRISEILPNSDERVRLTTFHSYATEILRRHGHHINLKSDFTILSQQEDRFDLLDDAIRDTIDLPTNFTSQSLISIVTKLIHYNVQPNDASRVLQRSNFKEYEAIAKIYSKYRRLMIRYNSIDFPTLIAEINNLFKKYPSLRRLNQKIYPYICVDEFQDTNRAQYMLLQHLVDPATNNLFVVADTNQTIYQWNGADPKFIYDIHSRYKMHQIHLPYNYRCPTIVIEYANKLVEKHKSQPVEKIKNETSRTVRVKNFDVFDEEVDWVAQDILVRSNESFKDFVVLARGNKLLGHAISALKKYGINAFSGVRKTEFSDESIHWLHTALRLANNRCNQQHLSNLCRSFSVIEGIEFDVDNILSRAVAEEEDYLRIWGSEVLNSNDVSDFTKNFIDNSLPLLIDRLDVWSFQDNAFQWLDAINTSQNKKNEFNEYENEKSAWKDIVDQINFKLNRKDITLNRLLQELDIRSKLSIPPDGSVPCFTIHSTKGMEFEHVYLIGMVENQLPSWHAVKSGDESQKMKEERRSCFVAITRTQKTLTITHSKQTFGYSTVPSRFLQEMELVDDTFVSSSL